MTGSARASSSTSAAATAAPAYLDEMRVTIAVVGRIEEDDLSAEARTELLAAFRDWERD